MSLLTAKLFTIPDFTTPLVAGIPVDVVTEILAPRHRYRLDEPSGTTIADTGYGTPIPGTLYGGTLGSTSIVAGDDGRTSTSFAHAGSDRVELAANPILSYPFTITGWLKAAAADQHRYIFWYGDPGFGGDIELVLASDADYGSAPQDFLVLAIDSGDGRKRVSQWSVDEVADGTAHHFAVVAAGPSTHRIYVDKVEGAATILTSGNGAPPIVTTKTLSALGGLPGSAGFGLGGLLAEVNIFNVALTAGQVADLYDAGDGGQFATFDRSWYEQKNDVGHAGISFAADDPNRDLCVLPNTAVSFYLEGQVAFTSIIDREDAVDLAQGEEHDQLSAFSGPGHLAVLGRARIDPTGGPGRKPVEQNRVFNWTAPAFDDSGWTAATEVALTADATDPVTGWPNVVNNYDPNTFADGFLDGTASILWASDGTMTTAATGTCWFRQSISIVTAGQYKLLFVADNVGAIYVDGQLIIDLPTHGDANNFAVAHSELIELSVGTHLVAFWGTNDASPPSNTNDPGGVAWTLYYVDATGELTGAIRHSDTSAVVLEYVADPPGMTHGQAIGILLDEAQARGTIPFVTKSFDDVNDSNGNPWSVVADLSTKVDYSILAFMREIVADVDFYMAPNTWVLDAYIAGTRGEDHTADVTWDTATRTLLAKARTEEAASGNSLLVPWAGGWAVREDAAAIAADGRIEATLSLGALNSTAEVDRVADGQLADTAGTRRQVTGTIFPAGFNDTPYLGFHGVCDQVTVDGEALQIIAMAVNEDKDTDEALFVPTFDSIVLDDGERFGIVVAKMLPGSGGGKSFAVQPVTNR